MARPVLCGTAKLMAGCLFQRDYLVDRLTLWSDAIPGSRPASVGLGAATTPDGRKSKVTKQRFQVGRQLYMGKTLNEEFLEKYPKLLEKSLLLLENYPYFWKTTVYFWKTTSYF